MQNRQRKREETRRRIIAEAGSLVDAHGYDNVTVEDVCAAADISRRTFFNYMDSKDEAVLGPVPFQLTADSLERIRSTQSVNVLDLVISSVEVVPEGTEPSISEQRRRLIGANPALLHLAIARQHETLAALEAALTEHYERFPGDRRLLDASDTDASEVHAIIALFRSAAGEYFWNPRPEGDPVTQIRHNANNLTQFAKELPW
ncbi:TetR/AcrR family transcriptional regulator [Corynebacterium sp. Q4381]|uniref:TetR/AcrR family transcriptional regulator n=1 Tax=Corynebacterium sp. Marseille-Q4381 TaxID=3121597 RepID=UPI002FE5626B